MKLKITTPNETFIISQGIDKDACTKEIIKNLQGSIGSTITFNTGGGSCLIIPVEVLRLSTFLFTEEEDINPIK